MQIQESNTLPSTETTDGILANNCLLGDELAFEGLYKRYRPALFKFIFNILRDYDLSCDILQQVFLQLYISLPTLKTNKPIKSLPPRFRSVVFLRYAKQLTFPEIGRTLGMPEATAKTYFSRAKPLLRASLAS